MTKDTALALVVSGSGSFQSGLLGLMTTIPCIGVVLVAEDVDSGMRLIEHHQPALVILDVPSLTRQNVVREVKTQWPHRHVIAIVKDIEQQREVEALGADRVLLIGFSARELVEAAEHAASISQLDAPGREERQ